MIRDTRANLEPSLLNFMKLDHNNQEIKTKILAEKHQKGLRANFLEINKRLLN